MKKKILINNKEHYNVQYIISKNKCFYYVYNKKNNLRKYCFFKNVIGHRNCNIGPQYRDNSNINYKENGNFHNLYGPAYIDKNGFIEYWINNIRYSSNRFNIYISIYNKLSYKRTY